MRAEPAEGDYPVAVPLSSYKSASAMRLVAATLLWLPVTSYAQQVMRATDASSVAVLVEDAARNQLADLHHAGWALRYRVHRSDSKEDTLRDLVESADGNIARTLQRNGQPLTPDQDAEEQQRLRSLDAAALLKRRRSGSAIDRYAQELIAAMPNAMLYTLAPNQPQLIGSGSEQTVLDYAPNPAFKAASVAQSLLSGIAGRLWIDKETHHLLRIEIHVTKDLNLALGLLARVYQGGSIVYEQHPVGKGHDAYSHIEVDVLLRELMVRTVPYHSTLDATEVVLLPAVPTLKQAVDLLLHSSAAKQP